MLVAGPDSHAWADRHELMAYLKGSVYFVCLWEFHTSIYEPSTQLIDATSSASYTTTFVFATLSWENSMVASSKHAESSAF
jgi:hypothetical protein